MKIYTPPEIAVEINFYVGKGNKTITLILPADGKLSYLLLASLVSLMSGGPVQAGNTYFFHSFQRGKFQHPLINLPSLHFEFPYHI